MLEYQLLKQRGTDIDLETLAAYPNLSYVWNDRQDKKLEQRRARLGAAAHGFYGPGALVPPGVRPPPPGAAPGAPPGAPPAPGPGPGAPPPPAARPAPPVPPAAPRRDILSGIGSSIGSGLSSIVSSASSVFGFGTERKESTPLGVDPRPPAPRDAIVAPPEPIEERIRKVYDESSLETFSRVARANGMELEQAFDQDLYPTREFIKRMYNLSHAEYIPDPTARIIQSFSGSNNQRRFFHAVHRIVKAQLEKNDQNKSSFQRLESKSDELDARTNLLRQHTDELGAAHGALANFSMNLDEATANRFLGLEHEVQSRSESLVAQVKAVADFGKNAVNEALESLQKESDAKFEKTSDRLNESFDKFRLLSSQVAPLSARLEQTEIASLAIQERINALQQQLQESSSGVQSAMSLSKDEREQIKQQIADLRGNMEQYRKAGSDIEQVRESVLRKEQEFKQGLSEVRQLAEQRVSELAEKLRVMQLKSNDRTNKSEAEVKQIQGQMTILTQEIEQIKSLEFPIDVVANAAAALLTRQPVAGFTAKSPDRPLVPVPVSPFKALEFPALSEMYRSPGRGSPQIKKHASPAPAAQEPETEEQKFYVDEFRDNFAFSQLKEQESVDLFRQAEFYISQMFPEREKVEKEFFNSNGISSSFANKHLKMPTKSQFQRKFKVKEGILDIEYSKYVAQTIIEKAISGEIKINTKPKAVRGSREVSNLKIDMNF